MSEPTPEALFGAFIERIEALDLDGACALVTDDVEYDNVPIGKSFGPDGIKAVLGPMLGPIEEVRFEVLRQVAVGPLVMNERVDRFRAGERWLELPVAGVFEVTGGKISLWRDFFDMRSFEEQLQGLFG